MSNLILLFLLTYNCEITAYGLYNINASIESIYKISGRFLPQIGNFYVVYPIYKGENKNVLVWIFVDTKNLYVYFKYPIEKSRLIYHLNKRDKFLNDDMFFVYISPKDNYLNTYVFGINPAGVIYDGIKTKDLTSESDEDYSVDFNFEGISMIEDSCWSGILKIPLNLVKSRNSYKVNIFLYKNIGGDLNILSPTKIDFSLPSFMKQGFDLIISDTLKGKAKELNFIPFFLLSIEKSSRLKGYFNSGFTLKSTLSDRSYFQLALNPDYAHIETDEPKIDINTNSALFYSEKRPFFMEEKSLYETPINAIYTRSINNPIIAAKIAYNFYHHNIFYLLGMDDNTLWIVPFEEGSEYVESEIKSFINILRVRSNILKDSYIGMLLGRKDFVAPSGYNMIGGIDTRLRFFNNFTIDYQGVFSKTKEIRDTMISKEFDSENLDGFAQEGNMNIFSKYFIGNIWLGDYSPGFRSDLGFIKRNNYREIELRGGPRVYPNFLNMKEISLWLWYSLNLNYENVLKERNKAISLSLLLPAQTNFITKYSLIEKKYFGKNFPDLWDYNISIYSSPSRYLSIYLYFDLSKTLYYAETLSCYSQEYFFSIEVKPTFQTQIEIIGSKYSLYEKLLNGLITQSTVVRAKFSYQFTQLLSMRLIMDYYPVNKFSIYPQFSYELTPFSVFYLGANLNALKDYRNLTIEDYEIFLKVQYAFKM